MKATDIRVGDTIRVSTPADSCSDAVTYEFTVKQIHDYATISCSSSGVTVCSTKGTTRVVVTPRDTIELLNRERSNGQIAYEAYCGYFARVFNWYELDEHIQEDWEQIAQTILEDGKK